MGVIIVEYVPNLFISKVSHWNGAVPVPHMIAMPPIVVALFVIIVEVFEIVDSRCEVQRWIVRLSSLPGAHCYDQSNPSLSPSPPQPNVVRGACLSALRCKASEACTRHLDVGETQPLR